MTHPIDTPSAFRIFSLGLLSWIVLPLLILGAHPAFAAEPAQSAAPLPAAHAKGVDAIVKLRSAGVDVSVILAFVDRTATISRLSAEDLVYLQQQGVPAEVMNAMLKRTGEAIPDSPAVATSVAPSPAPVVTTQTILAPVIQPVLYNTSPVVYPNYAYSSAGDYRYWGSTVYIQPYRTFGYGYGRPVCNTPWLVSPHAFHNSPRGVSRAVYSGPTVYSSRAGLARGPRHGR